MREFLQARLDYLNSILVANFKFAQRMTGNAQKAILAYCETIKEEINITRRALKAI